MAARFPNYSCHAPRGFAGVLCFDEDAQQWAACWHRLAGEDRKLYANPQRFGGPSTPEGERQRTGERLIAAHLISLGLVPANYEVQR